MILIVPAAYFQTTILKIFKKRMVYPNLEVLKKYEKEERNILIIY